MSDDFKKDLGGSEPDASAVERVWSGVREREAQRRPHGWFVLAAALLLAVVGLTLQLRATTPPVPSVTQNETTVQLAAGAQVELGHDAQLEPVGLHAVALRRGRATFTLQQGPWVVTSKRLRLEVASATFGFDVTDAADSVTVTRGEVRLSASGFEAITLREGQTFSTASQATWESLARNGELAAAWKVLGIEGVRAAAESAAPEKVMLLSDIAAAGADEPLSRELLGRVVESVDGGAERGLAAYTLGKRLEAEGSSAAARVSFQRSLELGLPVELRQEAEQHAK
jgi:hypothetical protein